MSSCTDPLRLNEKSLFKKLKQSLAGSAKETRNILEIRDNVLYVWNAEDSCLLTLNVAATRGKVDEEVPYQTLQPIDLPILEVTNISINETATQVALWGNLGIAVMELPKRWGKDGVFQGGKDTIICTSHSFGDFGATVEIRKARWHPGSTNDSHLLVLTSESTFCLYECELGRSPKLLKTWKVGRTPSCSPSKIPNFADLGEIAVDFDFATPTLRKPEMFADKDINEAAHSIGWNQIEWPILVLRGNGEVLLVRENVLYETYDKPVVYGALTMHPPADDNYGIDSCSIMCIQTTPPIVVIATSFGKIYHAILLRESSDDEDEKQSRQETSWSSQYDSTYSLHTPDDALYVFECVELELGLFFTDEDKKYNCPIYLHNDKSNRSRYFCSHNAGIHMVTLPMVSQLEEYKNTNEGDLLSLPNQSSLQYLICTRTKHTSKDEATPILGFGLIQDPCVLIALLYTGDVVDLSVVDLHYIPRIKLPEPIATTTKTVSKEPFDVYISKLLKHETSQPITKLGNRSMSSLECLELLYRATQIYRTQHFTRHEKAREEIGKKVRALKALKTHLLKELDTLVETKKELQLTAERLAERYEDIKDKQEELARRAEEVLRLVNYKQPSMSADERAETEELKKMDAKMHDLSIRVKQLKKKTDQYTMNLETTAVSEKKKEIIFSSNQEEAVKENLSQTAKDIKQMIAQVKKLEEEIGVW